MGRHAAEYTFSVVSVVNILDARVKACPPDGEAGPVGTGMTT